MAKVILASTLVRWLAQAPSDGGGACLQIAGKTLGEVLENLFTTHPGLRGYVLDERGVVRRHVAIFVDGESIRRKDDFDQILAENADVHVLQALSGG